MKSNEMNVSFGCYGARAASEIDDFEQYVSVPYEQLPLLAGALKKLAVKSIPEERRKIYMPPVIDTVSLPGQGNADEMEVIIDEKRCTGCGLCEAFCPSSVFVKTEGAQGTGISVNDSASCSACYTCVGQCPERALQLRPKTKS
jgi:NAD-dependent dihydropyrimidine dehydrogenase PreA subunit